MRETISGQRTRDKTGAALEKQFRAKELIISVPHEAYKLEPKNLE